MFATFFYFLPPQVSIALDLVVMGAVAAGVWLWQRGRADGSRDLPAGGERPADVDAVAEPVLVGASTRDD